MPLIGVNVVVKGTTYGASTDIKGQYNLNKVPAGVYQIEVSYLGYEKKLFTGIKISGNQPTQLDVSLAPSALTLDQEVVVVGEKPLVDLDQSKSEQRVSQESIENAPVRQLQGVLNTQAGVVLNPEGLSIRGGRTYETAFIIDGVSATDPLAGTGFGIDLGTNSVEGIDVTTGGGDVAYGDGTSGIVKTRTRSGGDRTEFSFNHRRDRFGAIRFMKPMPVVHLRAFYLDRCAFLHPSKAVLTTSIFVGLPIRLLLPFTVTRHFRPTRTTAGPAC
jgi:hypothetical protein